MSELANKISLDKPHQSVSLFFCAVRSDSLIDVSFHKFSPFGISGMVVIAESHLSIHTWPEYGYAALDIFTCGDIIKPEVAAQFLIEKFGCKNPSVVEMKRGILSHSGEKLPYKVNSPELALVAGCRTA